MTDDSMPGDKKGAYVGADGRIYLQEEQLVRLLRIRDRVRARQAEEAALKTQSEPIEAD